MAIPAFAPSVAGKHFSRFALIVAAMAIASATARAENQVQLLATDPASPATLGYGADFYLRIGYTSDRPIRVRAEAFSEGRRVTQMTSGSMLHTAGTGEAFFWLAYTHPQHVDTLQITASDDRTGSAIAHISVLVDIRWTGVRSDTPRVPADWVTRGKAEESGREKARYAAYLNRPAPWWTPAIFLAVWSIPAYFILQIVLLWRMRNGWRKAAAVPVAPMVAVVAYTIYAFLDGSNLFPLVLIFTAPLALIYLLVILGVKRLNRKPA